MTSPKGSALALIGAGVLLIAIVAVVLLAQGAQPQAAPSAPEQPGEGPSGGPSGTIGAPPSPASPPPSAPDINMTKVASGGLRMGSDSAPIIMVEFSDYQCPFCRRFWLFNYETLKEEYIDTGKVQLVYRDFPLSFHPAAELSAEAVACAEEQGKGWELHDMIFMEQANVSTGTVHYTETDLKEWAQMIGVDRTPFDACLDSGKYADSVRDSYNEGVELGVGATPSFIIGTRNGDNVVPITGALPYGTFKATIEQLLQ
jgi:protein-disulfide isomerase